MRPSPNSDQGHQNRLTVRHVVGKTGPARAAARRAPESQISLTKHRSTSIERSRSARLEPGLFA